MNPKIHETNRLVVSFSSLVKRHADQDLYPLSDKTVLLLAADHDPHSQTTQWICVDDFGWWYSAVGTLCRNRARRVEKGELLPGGTRMKAEDYLRLWRQARTEQIEFDQMLYRGLLLVATIAKPVAFLDSAETHKSYPLLQGLRTSPFVIQADDEKVVWRIPVTDLASVMAYFEISKGYVDSSKYPGDFAGVSFAVEHHPHLVRHGDPGHTAGIAATNSLPECEQADMFAEVA